MLQRYPRIVFAVLLFINIIGYVDRAMLLGFSPQITRELALSDTQFGFLSGTVWVLSYGIMAVVCGSLADRYSRTRIISVGMLIWSGCTAASGMAESFEQMMAARVLVAAGEAALVPAGTGLLADLFDERHRGTANGLFFAGIPLGIGLSYILSGTLGASMGWRGSYLLLGCVGVAIGLALWFVKDDIRRERVAGAKQGFNLNSAKAQVRAILQAFADRPVLFYAIAGFVCTHFALAGNYFVQLWLVRELGAEPAGIARQIGMLQIVAGCVGAIGGGLLADWVVRRTRYSIALVPILSLIICLPLMVASRFAGAGQAALYLGLTASFLLPFSIYGSSIGTFQKAAPTAMRSAIIGVAMLSLNIVAMALGTLLAGWLSDQFARAGSLTPLTWVLLIFDGLTALGLLGFIYTERELRKLPRDVK